MYEDVFLVISGLLASLNLLKTVENGNKTLWLKKIVKRYIRLAVPLAFVLLFYAYVWEHLGTGPQWSAVVDKNAELCKHNMWRNLLFIQNFYPVEDMVRKKVVEVGSIESYVTSKKVIQIFEKIRL